MDITALLSTGALLGFGGTLLYQLKGIPKLIYTKIKQRLVYTVSVYQYDDLFGHLELWLSHHYEKEYRDVEATTSISKVPRSVSELPQPSPKFDPKKPSIHYRQEDNTFILRYMGKKILIAKSKEKLDKAQSLKDIYFRKYTLTGFKARKQTSFLLEEVLSYSLSFSEENTIRVYTSTIYGEWRRGPEVKVKPMDRVVLPPLISESIIPDVENFLKSEKWYLDICIPYKRGYCLYGPPGTGKTTLALALANFTKRNIYCLNLNSLESDTRLPEAFSQMDDEAILLIEDIDKVFSGRENVNPSSKVTFSSLLNCLDGAFYKHGLITIITTNHIDKLDEALLRTGRIDMKIEVPNPSDREISKYLTLFYEQPVTIIGIFGMKMSDVQEICLSNRYSHKQAVKQIYTHQLTNGKLKQYELDYIN